MREVFEVIGKKSFLFALAAIPGFLLFRAVDFALLTLRWPLSISPDAMVNRTGAWLLIQNVWPYRDFNDINLPGTYFIHFLGLRIFGYDDTAFRLQDAAWNVLTSVCVFYFLRKHSKFAAWLGAALTLAIHCEATPFGAFQRESLMFVFWIAAALLFDRFANRGRESARQNFFAWSALGAMGAFSLLIKPTSIFLFLALFVYHSVLVVRSSSPVRRGGPAGFLLECGMGAVLGAVILSLAVAAVLHYNDALISFFQVVSQEYQGYVVESENKTLWQLFSELFALGPGHWNIPLNSPVAHAANIGHFGLFHLGILCFWVFAAVKEKWTLTPAFLFAAGLLNYVLQGKGFQYHLYPLWHAINIMTAMAASYLAASLVPAPWRTQHSWLPASNSRILRPAAAVLLAAMTVFLVTKHSLARRVYLGTGLASRYNVRAIPNWNVVGYMEKLETRMQPARQRHGAPFRMLHLDGTFVAMNMLMSGGMLPASRFVSDHLIWANTILGTRARTSFMEQITVSNPQVVVYRIANNAASEQARAALFPEYFVWLRKNYVMLERIEERNGAAYEIHMQAAFKVASGL